VFAGTPRVGRLVGVARVCRLVIHVRGQRWAEFQCHSCPRAAALLPDQTQLALAVADGLGSKSQRKAQQVHFTSEGIYLEGLGKERRMGGGRRVKDHVRKQRAMGSEERKKIICHVRHVKSSQKGQIPSNSNEKRDSIVRKLALRSG